MGGKSKAEKFDKELGHETTNLGEAGASGSPGGQVSPDYKVKCICCGLLKAKPGFKYCFSCHKKWQHVYDAYRSAGFDKDIAIKRATKAYPPRYG